MQEISWLAMKMLASLEELCPKQSIQYILSDLNVLEFLYHPMRNTCSGKLVSLQATN
jgi:hypothetical protein